MANADIAALPTSFTAMRWKTGSSPSPPCACIKPLCACSSGSKPGIAACGPVVPYPLIDSETMRGLTARRALVRDAEPLAHAEPVVVEHDVGLRDQFEEHVLARRDASGRARATACRGCRTQKPVRYERNGSPASRLDLHDVGAEAGEHRARVGTRDHDAEVEHLHTGERRFVAHGVRRVQAACGAARSIVDRDVVRRRGATAGVALISSETPGISHRAELGMLAARRACRSRRWSRPRTTPRACAPVRTARRRPRAATATRRAAWCERPPRACAS